MNIFKNIFRINSIYSIFFKIDDVGETLKLEMLISASSKENAVSKAISRLKETDNYEMIYSYIVKLKEKSIIEYLSNSNQFRTADMYVLSVLDNVKYYTVKQIDIHSDLRLTFHKSCI